MVGTAVASPAGQTFTPITSTQQTLTIYCYYDGILHKLTGAMGTFRFLLKLVVLLLFNGPLQVYLMLLPQYYSEPYSSFN
jgi:hypothetical protein